jgi:aspartyl-tRNA(Asn)/glutamyl-tRNA(Gln) amidotransferase subunit B
MMGAVKSYLNESAKEITDFQVSPQRLAQLIDLVDKGKISNTIATQTLFPILLKESSKAPMQIAEENNLIQESGEDALAVLVQQAIARYPEKVAEYKSGKVGLIGLFMGELMKLSGGKADPKIANELMRRALEKSEKR